MHLTVDRRNAKACTLPSPPLRPKERQWTSRARPTPVGSRERPLHRRGKGTRGGTFATDHLMPDRPFIRSETIRIAMDRPPLHQSRCARGRNVTRSVGDARPGSNRALPIYRAHPHGVTEIGQTKKSPPMKQAKIDDFLGGYGSQVNDQEVEQIPPILAWIRNGNPGFPRCFTTNRVSRRR